MGMAQGANVDAADITQEPGSTAHQQYSSQFLTDVDQVLVDLGRVHRSPTYLLTYKSYFMILVYLCLPLSDNIFFCVTGTLNSPKCTVWADKKNSLLLKKCLLRRQKMA